MTQVATILVKRQSDGYQLWGRRRDTNLYTTPGGKFEDDESPEQAAARELFEEAGIVVNPDHLVKLVVQEFPERNLTVHCFVVIVPDSVKPSSANDPDHEVSVWEWLPSMPIDTHAKPNALETYAKPAGFTLRKLRTRAPGQVNFTVIQSKIAPTDNNKIFKFIASTNEVDRHGTRLLPRGCQHINFDKNPVFLWNHNKDGLPDDVIGRVLSLEITDSEVIATIEFMTERPNGSRRERAWQCWQDVLAGILKAVSVGFIPLMESPTFKSPEESAKYLAGGGVIDVTQWDLCELSLCPIGSNPDALQVRKLPTIGRFTIARRDVIDDSGHKHKANGQFGSGGSAKSKDKPKDKPKKELGAAASAHSAAAHEAKTHQAHRKAGIAHAAVARAALKRGDTDKANSALAQAKLHRDEAKKIKSGKAVSVTPDQTPEVKPMVEAPAQAKPESAKPGKGRLLTEAQASKWTEKHYANWAKTLPPDEREAINTYIKPDFQAINGGLRQNNGDLSKVKGNLEYATGTVPDAIKAFDRALAKAPPLPETVQATRIMKSDALAKSLGLAKGFDVSTLKPGAIIQDHGYMSTDGLGQFRANLYNDIEMRITLPKGSKVGVLAKGAGISNRGVTEFTIPRGGKLQITKVRKVGKTHIVEATLVNE